jgi:WD40 repeat protein
MATTQGLILATEDTVQGQIRLVDAFNERMMGTIPLGRGRAFPAAFDVTSDFRLAAYLVDDGTNRPDHRIEIWDLKAGELRTRLSPALGPIKYLNFNPDRRLLACMAENGVLVLETSQFTPVNTYRQLTAGRAVWCGDGTRLALPLSQENGVRLCSVSSGTDATRLTTQHQVKDVRSSLDGSALLMVPYTGLNLVVRLTGSREGRHMAGHVGGTPAVEFSPDGQTIASTGKDGAICLWNAQSGKKLKGWQIPRGFQGQSLGFSPDGRWLASGNYQNEEVLVWAVEDGRQVLKLGDGHGTDGTWSCSFSPDGRFLLAAGIGLRAWELLSRPSGATEPPFEARMLFNHAGFARNLQIHPTGKWFAFEGSLRLNGQDVRGSFIEALEPGSEPEVIDQHAYTVQTLGIDVARGTVVHMTRDRSLHFHDPQTHAAVRNFSPLSAGEISSTYLLNFRISPDSSKVAVANHNGRGINIHDLASGQRLYTLPDDASPIWWLAWHPDGRQLAVARGDGDISLWNLNEVEAVLAEVGLAP